VRGRWTLLFYMAVATLVGVAWLARRFDSSLASWINIQMLGMIAASGIAFVAMIRNIRERWPAAVALICAAPMAEMLSRALLDVPWLIQYLGLPGVLMIGGSVATIGVALFILIAKVPPKPSDPIPRAKQR
jgi:hypothetical protein